MENGMVERVARALQEASGVGLDPFVSKLAARAAIEAMREPLEDAAFGSAACIEDVGFNIAQFFDAALDPEKQPA